MASATLLSGRDPLRHFDLHELWSQMMLSQIIQRMVSDQHGQFNQIAAIPQLLDNLLLDGRLSAHTY